MKPGWFRDQPEISLSSISQGSYGETSQMNGPSQQISFRLAGEYAAEIDRRAAERGVSRGDYVRQVIIATVTSDPAEETRNRVAELQDELQKLRQELWTGVTALLVHAGKADAETAKRWVEKSLVK